MQIKGIVQVELILILMEVRFTGYKNKMTLFSL